MNIQNAYYYSDYISIMDYFDFIRQSYINFEYSITCIHLTAFCVLFLAFTKLVFFSIYLKQTTTTYSDLQPAHDVLHLPITQKCYNLFRMMIIMLLFYLSVTFFFFN